MIACANHVTCLVLRWTYLVDLHRYNKTFYVILFFLMRENVNKKKVR